MYEDVYVIYDGWHVLKLIRNALASGVDTGEDMCDSEENVISWTFLQHLVNFQEMQGLHAGNKLRRQHINWKDNKMNVRIAAQTLSSSLSSTN